MLRRGSFEPSNGFSFRESSRAEVWGGSIGWARVHAGSPVFGTQPTAARLWRFSFSKEQTLAPGASRDWRLLRGSGTWRRCGRFNPDESLAPEGAKTEASARDLLLMTLASETLSVRPCADTGGSGACGVWRRAAGIRSGRAWAGWTLFSSFCQNSPRPALRTLLATPLFSSFCQNQCRSLILILLSPASSHLFSSFCQKQGFLWGGRKIASAFESAGTLCIVRTPVSITRPFFRR